MRTFRLGLVGLLAAGLLAACGGSATSAPASSTSPPPSAAVGAAVVPPMQGTLTIFAAASLTEAFNQMKANIQSADPGAKVVVNYAGSQILRTQLGQGAKADLFASADTANMQGAIADGSIDGQPTVFAHNKLAVVIPASGGKVSTLQDLARPGVKVVIEQQSVPAGNYSRQALAKMDKDPAYASDFSAKVLANVVSQETDVKGVLSRIQLGEADAGLLYVSDIATAQPGSVKSIAIPDQFNVIADYPIAMVRNAPNPSAAKAFLSYLMDPQGGQAILAKNGLVPVNS